MFNLIKNLLNNLKNNRLYNSDHILNQERFEPAFWAKPVNIQIKNLKKFLPGIKIDKKYLAAKIKTNVPRGYSRIVIPKLMYLSKLYKTVDPYTQIGILTDHACELLSINRGGNFTHYRKGQLGPDRIQVFQKIALPRIELEKNIAGDMLILDVDMGNYYAGWTPRRAREDITYRKDVMALSSVDICWIVLLNPDRFQRNTDLSVDSVFEEYLSLDRGWVTNLFMYHRGGKLEFGYRWNRRAYFDCGASIAKIH